MLHIQEVDGIQGSFKDLIRMSQESIKGRKNLNLKKDQVVD